MSYYGFVNVCAAASKIRGTGWPCLTNAIQHGPLTAKVHARGNSLDATGFSEMGSSNVRFSMAVPEELVSGTSGPAARWARLILR
jgi:hypothetical protein